MAEAKADSRSAVSRPLSPHLQVYRLALTMAMSIVHRITGAALYFGTLLVAWYLVAAAIGPGAFSTAQWVFSSWLGQLVLFGYTWALLHHMFGGMRHLIWDTGSGYDAIWRFRLTQISLIASIALTILIWIAVIASR